jgi:hypothetical protein
LRGEVFRHDLDTGDGERIVVGSPIAADGQRVVYTRCDTELDCALVTQRLDGDDAATLLDGYVPQPWGEALSPDGRWLRVERYLDHEPEALIVDLETGETHSHPHRVGATGSGPPTYTWTPGGEWFLQPAGSSVRARRPDGNDSIQLQLQIGGVEAVTAVR